MTSFRLSPTWVCGTMEKSLSFYQRPKIYEIPNFLLRLGQLPEIILIVMMDFSAPQSRILGTVPFDVVIGLCYLLLDSYIELSLVKKFGNYGWFFALAILGRLGIIVRKGPKNKNRTSSRTLGEGRGGLDPGSCTPPCRCNRFNK